MMIQINLWWFLAVLLVMGFVAYIIGHCAGRDESRERAEVLRTVQMLGERFHFAGFGWQADHGCGGH